MGLLLLLTGCAGSHYDLKLGGEASMHTKPDLRLNAQDMEILAGAAVRSLLDANLFEGGPYHPAVLALGRFVNETAQQLDLALLTTPICDMLLKTGKVVVAQPGQRPFGSSARSEASHQPDFVLSGRLVQQDTEVGGIRQSTFRFQCLAADGRGMVVWAETKAIVKQSKRL